MSSEVVARFCRCPGRNPSSEPRLWRNLLTTVPVKIQVRSRHTRKEKLGKHLDQESCSGSLSNGGANYGFQEHSQTYHGDNPFHVPTLTAKTTRRCSQKSHKTKRLSALCLHASSAHTEKKNEKMFAVFLRRVPAVLNSVLLC